MFFVQVKPQAYCTQTSDLEFT